MAKVMISIPDDFLRQVDDLAKKEHRSRSELFRESLREYLIHHRFSYPRPIDNPRVKSAIQHMREGAFKWRGDKEASRVIREMRDTRFGK